MITLEAGSERSNTLTTPGEVHTYAFALDPDQRAQVTFTAPSLEYVVNYKLSKALEEKGDTADGHEGGEIDFKTTTAYSIHNTKGEKSIVTLTVAASDQTSLPSDGYTIAMELVAG